MKFVCTQENLSRGLNLVSRVSSKNIALPILNNVLIEAVRGKIILRTTNLELGMSVLVRGNVEREGKFTVQSRVLSEFVSNLGDENITFDQVDQELLAIGGDLHASNRGRHAPEGRALPACRRNAT